MSAFCSLDEAFAIAPQATVGKPSKKHRTKGREGFTVPISAPSTPDPDPDRQAQIQPASDDLLQGPPGGAATNVVVSSSGLKLDDMFPLPGDTGDSDEWEKAFTLPGSRMPPPAPPGAVAVDGKATLWRQIPVPIVAQPAPMPMGGAMEMVPAELSARLDALTRQLESLTTPAPLQSTAELFLFVAIGLLVLLAIDTLLRFAVRMASGAVRMSGGGGGRRFGGGGRLRFGRSRWF
jgi:hypothetical protein